MQAALDKQREELAPAQAFAAEQLTALQVGFGCITAPLNLIDAPNRGSESGMKRMKGCTNRQCD